MAMNGHCHVRYRKRLVDRRLAAIPSKNRSRYDSLTRDAGILCQQTIRGLCHTSQPAAWIYHCASMSSPVEARDPPATPRFRSWVGTASSHACRRTTIPAPGGNSPVGSVEEQNVSLASLMAKRPCTRPKVLDVGRAN